MLCVRTLHAVVMVCLEWHCCPSPLLLRWLPCSLEGLVWRMQSDSCIAKNKLMHGTCHVMSCDEPRIAVFNCPVIANTHFVFVFCCRSACAQRYCRGN